MRQLGRLLGLLALAFPAVPAVTAAPVSWTYRVSATPGSIPADAGGDSITLFTPPGATVTGATSINALNFNTLTPELPGEHFTNKDFTLALNLTDNGQNKSGSLTFLGTLNGTLAPSDNGVDIRFAKMSGALDLGKDRFDVTLHFPTAPGLGIVTAQVNVAAAGSPGPPPGPKPGPEPGPGPGPRPGPGPQPHDSPEPSALLLAGLGLSTLGGRAWWCWKRA